jgi:hypothetical protein
MKSFFFVVGNRIIDEIKKDPKPSEICGME